MDTLKQKQLEFLEDTVSYFAANPTLRRNIADGACRYYPIWEGSEGCAIGRHLPRELAKWLDDKWGGCCIYLISEFLPEELKALEIVFLQRVQDLHDGDENWFSEGLTYVGKNKVKQIKIMFGLFIKGESDESKYIT